jgi:hypothetical protein
MLGALYAPDGRACDGNDAAVHFRATQSNGQSRGHNRHHDINEQAQTPPCVHYAT